MTTFAEAAARIRATTDPADLFGRAGDPAAARRRYQRWARLVHPDTATDPDAAAVFGRLTELRDRHLLGGVTAGDIAGDIADVRLRDGAVWKIARQPVDNDLLDAEAGALRRLAGSRFDPYFPELYDSVTVRDPATGADRRASVLRPIDGFVHVRDLIDARPAGYDPRDVAWIWRRLLVALGHAHRRDVIHGAVLPDHVLIHPEDHGLVLIDWCYSVAPGERVRAIVGRRRELYPPEVLARRPVSPATDLFMAARTVDLLLGRDRPPRMRAFLRGAGSAPDAWVLLHELDDLLERLYGPRRFRPFHLPAGTPRT